MRSLLRPIAISLGLAALLAFEAVPAQDGSRFYEAALASFNEGRLEEAVLDVKNALQRAPSFLPAHVLLARIYLRMGAAAAAN